MAMNAGTRTSLGVSLPPRPVKTASDLTASSSPCCPSGGGAFGFGLGVGLVLGRVSGGGVVTGSRTVATGGVVVGVEVVAGSSSPPQPASAKVKLAIASADKHDVMRCEPAFTDTTASL